MKRGIHVSGWVGENEMPAFVCGQKNRMNRLVYYIVEVEVEVEMGEKIFIYDDGCVANFFRKATTTASSETLQVNEDEVAVAVGKTSERPTQLTGTMDQEECSITTYISGQLHFFCF